MARSDSIWASASAWRRLFSTSAARSPASVSRKRRRAGVNSRGSTVWTLRTPTTWSSQTSGTEHIEVKRAWSTPRIQAKRSSVCTSGLTTVERDSAAMPVMP